MGGNTPLVSLPSIELSVKFFSLKLLVSTFALAHTEQFSKFIFLIFFHNAAMNFEVYNTI